MTPEYTDELDTQMMKLKTLLEQQGKVLGIDFDDVLTHTNRMFRKHINLFLSKTLWHLPGLSEQDFRQKFEEANNQVFHRYGVNPNRWEQVVDLLTERFGSPEEQEVIQELKYHFANIYTDTPELKPGAIEFLEALVRHDIPFIIITHANEDWTWHKIGSTDLHNYLNPDNVEIVNEDGHKDREAFLELCKKKDLLPHQIILIEDSLRSIRAAKEAGITDSVLITNPEGWAMYTEGEVPEETHVVGDLLEITDKLVEKLSGGGGI